MNAILIRITAPLALAIGSMTPATARPADGLGPLLGSWRVTGVAVAASPVQAVTPDDPSLMGAILDVARERLSWRAPYRSRSLSYSCATPRLVRGAILCDSGSFGPPGSRVTRRGDTLTMRWYDGAILRLTRVAARPGAAALTIDGLGSIKVGAAPPTAGYQFRATGYSPDEPCRPLSDPALVGVEAIMEGGRVTDVRIGGYPAVSEVRTDRGIGIGSSESDVRAAYGPLQETAAKYDDPPGKNLVWRPAGSRNGLRFEIDSDRRVAVMHAGIDPALMYAEGCL